MGEVLSCTESSFSIRSASALLVMSNGSKPRSSSCCLVEEPKPKAACQSVEDETGMVSKKGKKKTFIYQSTFNHRLKVNLCNTLNQNVEQK